jgi:hypothetical protein
MILSPSDGAPDRFMPAIDRLGGGQGRLEKKHMFEGGFCKIGWAT